MASIPSRTTSGYEKRTSGSIGARSRVASSRAGDVEKASTHEEESPAHSENRAGMKGHSTGSKRLSRDINASERRTERTTTTTKERLQVRTRSPVKESAGAGNRREVERERVRRDTESPLARRRQQELEEGKRPKTWL